jgi:hypothetical protein
MSGGRVQAYLSAGLDGAVSALRVCGKGGKVVLIRLPPAVGRAVDRAITGRIGCPILLNGARTDRHAANRRPRQLPRRGRGRPAPAGAATSCQSVAAARR